MKLLGERVDHDAFHPLKDDPTIVEALQPDDLGVARRAYHARIHPLLGPFLLVETYGAASARHFNECYPSRSPRRISDSDAPFEWLGVFRPINSKPLPLVIPAFFEGEVVAGSKGARDLPAAAMGFGDLLGSEQRVLQCQESWSAQLEALYPQVIGWVRGRNEHQVRENKPVFQEPSTKAIVVVQCNAFENGDLLFEVGFEAGFATVYWFGDRDWSGWQIDFNASI